MLKSMTGFGVAEAEDHGYKIGVELRSVNHRYLDISLRLPRPLLAFEDIIKTRVRERIDRGRVSLSFAFESRGELEEIGLNQPLVRAYGGVIRQLAGELGLGDGALANPAFVGAVVGSLIEQPEVLVRGYRELDADAVQKLLQDVIDHAIDQANQMKEREGSSLGEDLGRRLALVAASVERVERLAPRVPEQARTALRARLARLLDGGEIEPQRLAQEVALVADKSDITEECVRLRSHLQQFRAAVASREQGARRMGFLLQEMHREVNTIGSKTTQLEITHEVLRMKEEIEKLREQIQNLE
jgi:uncharacterized protein (TIGR00255 family)